MKCSLVNDSHDGRYSVNSTVAGNSVMEGRMDAGHTNTMGDQLLE